MIRRNEISDNIELKKRMRQNGIWFEYLRYGGSIVVFNHYSVCLQSREIMIPIKSPLVRENKPDSLALKPYFLFLCFNARSSSSGVAKAAYPLSHSPLGFPLMPDGTMRTLELFRRRLTLPVYQWCLQEPVDI